MQDAALNNTTYFYRTSTVPKRGLIILSSRHIQPDPNIMRDTSSAISLIAHFGRRNSSQIHATENSVRTELCVTIPCTHGRAPWRRNAAATLAVARSTKCELELGQWSGWGEYHFGLTLPIRTMRLIPRSLERKCERTSSNQQSTVRASRFHLERAFTIGVMKMNHGESWGKRERK
jgi:hypothetical protein